MTTEQIIQRLLDEKHITVLEAVQMIKDLVRNEVFIPAVPADKKKTYYRQPTVVMYGVDISNTEYYSDNAIQSSNSLSINKEKGE